MSDEVDLGWSAPPFGLGAIEQRKIRVVGRGDDIPSIESHIVRFRIANTALLDQRRDAIARCARAYREPVDWMYSDPADPSNCKCVHTSAVCAATY